VGRAAKEAAEGVAALRRRRVLDGVLDLPRLGQLHRWQLGLQRCSSEAASGAARPEHVRSAAAVGARGVWQGERGARAGWLPIFVSRGTLAGDEDMAGSSGDAPWVVSRGGCRSSPAGGRSALMPVTWGAGPCSSGLLPPSVSCGAPEMLSSAQPAPDRVCMHTGAQTAGRWGGGCAPKGWQARPHPPCPWRLRRACTTLKRLRGWHAGALLLAQLRGAPPKKPLKGLLPFLTAFAAESAASDALSDTASLAPLAASFTPDTASEGLAGATSSSLSLAPAARVHIHSFRRCGVRVHHFMP